ncbi:spermidine synthase [bacterium B13(2017)]|nr:spermidine synthase [bacterium B13(2017)]
MNSSELWFTEYNSFSLDERTNGFCFKIKNHLASDKSNFQTLDIYETYEYGNVLVLDGVVMLTEKDEFVYHDMITHVPYQLLNYNDIQAENALVIGGGDGGTVRELLKYNSIKKIILCEIDDMVVNYSRKYFPKVSCGLDDPRVEVIIGDGIEFMKKQNNKFDIICIDSTDPIGPAVGLFNAEFYQNIYKALKEHGIVTSQQESYISGPQFVEKMNQMLSKIYPNVKFYKADISTYPTGTWCFVLASKKLNPLDCYRPDFTEKINFESKYYNSRIHQGAFALPTYINKILS